jgi:hypothetical protein
MPARKPEECDTILVDAINKGDLEAAIALYEPNARFVQESGEVVTGHPAIREEMKGFLALKPKFSIKVRWIQIAMVSSMQLFPLRYSPLISSRIAPSGSLKQTMLILASDESRHFVGRKEDVRRYDIVDLCQPPLGNRGLDRFDHFLADALRGGANMSADAAISCVSLPLRHRKSPRQGDSESCGSSATG